MIILRTIFFTIFAVSVPLEAMNKRPLEKNVIHDIPDYYAWLVNRIQKEYDTNKGCSRDDIGRFYKEIEVNVGNLHDGKIIDILNWNSPLGYCNDKKIIRYPSFFAIADRRYPHHVTFRFFYPEHQKVMAGPHNEVPSQSYSLQELTDIYKTMIEKLRKNWRKVSDSVLPTQCDAGWSVFIKHEDCLRNEDELMCSLAEKFGFGDSISCKQDGPYLFLLVKNEVLDGLNRIFDFEFNVI